MVDAADLFRDLDGKENGVLGDCQGRDARSLVQVAVCHGPRELKVLLGSKADLERQFRVVGKSGRMSLM